MKVEKGSECNQIKSYELSVDFILSAMKSHQIERLKDKHLQHETTGIVK